MHETVKEVDEETVTKENVTYFTRYDSTSLQYDNVEDIGEINKLLMIEVELTKNDKTIVKLKDNSLYLLKYVKHIIQDRPNENFVDDDNKKDEIVEIVYKRRCEQAVSES